MSGWVRILVGFQFFFITICVAIIFTLSERSGWMKRQNEISLLLLEMTKLNKGTAETNSQRITRIEKKLGIHNDSK